MQISVEVKRIKLNVNMKKIHNAFQKATSKTWTRTLKNMDPEKPGINIGLKNMSHLR